MRMLLEPSWAVLEFELAAMLHCVIASYWARMQAGRVFRPTLQVRLYRLRAPAHAVRSA